MHLHATFLAAARSAALPMPAPRLALLDVTKYDVFAVASAWFWTHKKEVVLGFFRQLERVSSSGFLVTQDSGIGSSGETVCAEARTHSIVCVVSSHMCIDKGVRNLVGSFRVDSDDARLSTRPNGDGKGANARP